MTFIDELPADERETAELAAQLRDSGNLHPLIARLRGGGAGRERARDALQVLAEIDIDLLVQMTLACLNGAYESN